MPADLTALIADLAAETAALRAMTDPLDDAGWRRDTPAAGWTVADQVGHLAHFDDAAVLSATDPDTFRAEAARVEAAGGIDPDRIAERYRHRPPAEVRAWFARARPRLLEVFAGLDLRMRMPWFGPDMSVASAVTARLMETWAHGQDIADTLGVVRSATDRLAHIAHLGVAARAYSFAANGRPAPTVPVRIDLVLPSGRPWSAGPDGAADRVSGSAVDFCLVITQRRHRDDTDLMVTGPAAQEWIAIGQAFAGKPGSGRKPGQFRSGQIRSGQFGSGQFGSGQFRSGQFR
jgi:uncharacterized protein (TIGR03084 family)